MRLLAALNREPLALHYESAPRPCVLVVTAAVMDEALHVTNPISPPSISSQEFIRLMWIIRDTELDRSDNLMLRELQEGNRCHINQRRDKRQGKKVSYHQERCIFTLHGGVYAFRA